MAANKKNIVILGAGFCGLKVAKHLAANLEKTDEYNIIIVDRQKVQVYFADLYEISTAYNEEITEACLRILKDSTTISIKKSIDEKKIDFIQDTVEKIDHENKKVTLKKEGDLKYEYLVMALGSVTNFYDIPGLKEKSYPLKTLSQALELNCDMDKFFRKRWKDKKKDEVHIVIGGGGFTGVEYACELSGYVRKLSRKYHFDPEEVRISVVQSGDQFVGLGEDVSNVVKKRFKKFGINGILGTRIAGFENRILTVCNKENICKRSMQADIMIWTAGVKPHPRVNDFPKLHEHGGLETKPTLETTEYPKVYAGGDNAVIMDPKKNAPVPKTAQVAIQEGKLIGENIVADINGTKQKSFRPVFKGFIMPMGGTYYVYNYKNITFGGIIPYLMKKFVDVTYFANYMSPFAAIIKVIHSHHIFSRND